MTSTISNPMNAAFFPTGDDWSEQSNQSNQTEHTDLTELVRGQEEALLARLTPLVRRQSLTLDLGTVQRIDAAGIAVLISLHASAHEAGQRFTVSNPTPHVAEILALVGLERILLSHNAVKRSHSDARVERPAA